MRKRKDNGVDLTTVISFPLDLLNAFVHAVFLGFFLSLKFLWHLLLQNRNSLQSFLTKCTPCPGYIGPPQKKHFSILILLQSTFQKGTYCISLILVFFYIILQETILQLAIGIFAQPKFLKKAKRGKRGMVPIQIMEVSEPPSIVSPRNFTSSHNSFSPLALGKFFFKLPMQKDFFEDLKFISFRTNLKTK